MLKPKDLLVYLEKVTYSDEMLEPKPLEGGLPPSMPIYGQIPANYLNVIRSNWEDTTHAQMSQMLGEFQNQQNIR